ncbi:RCC1 domain-containing protein [Catellatospora tritici]|uniref:RCC1 domain-containing protein n=1 Tax=Catellatospora tritici TaxID=2851566 RepID=UPI001C2D7181|nr:hypothetical protein [Catellatospora tritici]MBV1853196.1 hypothetical protein [Catellatospora tritici]
MRTHRISRRRAGAIALGTLLALPVVANAGADPAAANDIRPAVAFGFNNHGQLGDGTSIHRFVPVGVNNLVETKQVSAGGFHSLALLTNGTVRSWGWNESGQLGDGTTTERTVPGTVVGLSGVRAVAAGFAFSLALLDNGKIMAWGANDSGQLGIGTSSNDPVRLPVEVKGISNARAISAGGAHGLALLDDGKVMVWGIGVAPQVTATPFQVANLDHVRAVAAGDAHSLALLEDGTVKAWGANDRGQLGTGAISGPTFTPARVVNLDDVEAVAAGGAHSLALLDNGTGRAWGDNLFGQLGIGSFGGQRSTPTRIVGLSHARAIAAGDEHSLALSADDDDVILSWGSDSFGGLGGGTLSQQDRPVTVQSSLTRVRSIDGGNDYSLAAG